MVTGVVTGFARASPHARIDPDSTNVHGDVEHRVAEIDSPNASAEDWLAQGHVKDG
jgi:hypothetical protein